MSAQYAQQLRDQINELQRQYDKLNAQLTSVSARLEAFQEALAMFEGRADQPKRQRQSSGSVRPGSRVPDPARSPGWGAALTALQQAPSNGYALDEIVAATEEAGHPVKRNTLRSILSHAVSEGIVERVSVGRYRAAENAEPPDAETSDGSEASDDGGDHGNDSPSVSRRALDLQSGVSGLGLPLDTARR